MGFGGFLSPRETGGAWAVPEPREAEEQLHPVPAEGGCLPQPPQVGFPARVPSSASSPLCVHFQQNLVLQLVLGGRNAIVLRGKDLVKDLPPPAGPAGETPSLHTPVRAVALCAPLRAALFTSPKE